MSKTAIILMTALVPTTGHRDLIDFATQLTDVDNVTVIVQSRSFEPVSGEWRGIALYDEFLDSNVSVNVIVDEWDAAPQNPGDVEDFWEVWDIRIRGVLKRTLFPNYEKTDLVLVGSEMYGVDLSREMGIEFIPYDIARQINPVKGNMVRADIAGKWNDILPTFRRQHGITATLFGQESTGKTTKGKTIARLSGGRASFVPEYAREYLEVVGPELNQRHMHGIERGQTALQHMAWERSATPIILQDTDLYSTIGYATFAGYEIRESLLTSAEAYMSDVYFLMPDDIPLEPDPIRYGGDKRESTYEFWKELGEHYGLNIVEVPSGDAASKTMFIWKHLAGMWDERVEAIEDFVRD